MTTSEPYTYFQPGEMLFLLTRNTDPPIDIQIDNFDLLMNEVWIPFVDEVVKAHDPNLAITRRKDRELHFAGTLERPVIVKRIGCRPGPEWTIRRLRIAPDL